MAIIRRIFLLECQVIDKENGVGIVSAHETNLFFVSANDVLASHDFEFGEGQISSCIATQTIWWPELTFGHVARLACPLDWDVSHFCSCRLSWWKWKGWDMYRWLGFLTFGFFTEAVYHHPIVCLERTSLFVLSTSLRAVQFKSECFTIGSGPADFLALFEWFIICLA